MKIALILLPFLLVSIMVIECQGKLFDAAE